MRHVVIELATHFGVHLNTQIHHYLAEQYVRESSYKGCAFRLSDIDETSVARSVLSAVKQLGLTATELFEHTMIRPFVDKTGTIKPMLQFKASFFQSLLQATYLCDVSRVLPEDTIEFKGKSHPVVHCAKQTQKKMDSIGGFVSGETVSGEVFSLYLRGEEWQQIKNTYYSAKLNDVDFVDHEWCRETEKTFLFHRLIDEYIGSVLKEENETAYGKYRAAVEHETVYFHQKATSSSSVYSSRGYRIGHTVKLFDEVDVLSARKEKKLSTQGKSTLTVVVDNSQHKTLNPASAPEADYEDDQYCEWGAF